MKKLNEAELFINKLNACNEPILTKEGTKHAIEIIDQQNKEIETEITLNKQLLEDIDKSGKEIKRLNNIIKEIREDIEDTIERYKYYGTNDLDLSILSFWVEKLQILDKGE